MDDSFPFDSPIDGKKRQDYISERKVRTVTDKVVASIGDAVDFLQETMADTSQKRVDRIAAAKALLISANSMKAFAYDLEEKRQRIVEGKYRLLILEKDAYLASRELSEAKGEIVFTPKPTEEIDMEFEEGAK